MQKRFHLIVHGLVQGVLYRDFVMMAGRKHSITGYVKNLPDGTVEVVGEGEEKKLAELVKECRRGSFKSRVDSVDVVYEEPQGTFESFVIEF